MNTPRADDDPRWYRDGLCFECTQCGHCCVVEGYVWVTLAEMEAFAEHLGLSFDAFTRQYVRRVGRRYSLIEKPNHECIFWEDGCTVYPVRPTQCRTFPFWSEQILDEESWQETATECEGIGRGRRYTPDEIDVLAVGVGETGSETGAESDDTDHGREHEDDRAEEDGR